MQEMLRNKTAGEECLENTIWETKPVCSAGTGKMIEKKGEVFKSMSKLCT